MGASTSRVPHPEESISWYRTKIPREVHKQLHTKSDFQGFIQTFAFLGMLFSFFVLALYFNQKAQFALTIVFTLLYGMQANFLINGMHELGHGCVFQTRWLNNFFLRVLSFLGWLHPDMFFSSHLRHHRYTQNLPHDQENPMPVLLTVWHFLSFGFINIKGCYEILSQTFRAATGTFPTGHLGWLPGWEEICYPSDKLHARTPAMQWAQFMIFGHLLIGYVSVSHGQYLVPVLISFGPFYNGWLFWLCNSTQHVGLPYGNFEENRVIPDFRMTTRTFYLNNPLIRMWYWYMNFHIEHHMYANVPCYNLPALHEAIKHDLPHTPSGFVETWTIIAENIEKQKIDATHMQDVKLPANDG